MRYFLYVKDDLRALHVFIRKEQIRNVFCPYTKQKHIRSQKGCEHSTISYVYFNPEEEASLCSPFHCLTLPLSHTCTLVHLACSSPQKDRKQPHPAFFTHYFIVCLNPTQSQKQGVCLQGSHGVRRERGQGGTCYYNLSSIRQHSSQWDYCALFGISDSSRGNTTQPQLFILNTLLKVAGKVQLLLGFYYFYLSSKCLFSEVVMTSRYFM